MLNVIQSWDDGVVDDIRLAELCRKHRAKASFNLNPGLHGTSRGAGWKFGDKQVLRLSRGELESTYAGFEIANHTMTHPDLTRLSPDQLVMEIAEARKKLQEWFGQPIDGFCYPYGRAIQGSQQFIEQTGHRFARDAHELTGVKPGSEFRLVQPHCHFTAPDFWGQFEKAKQDSGYFFFWGHSYEMVSEAMWNAIDDVYARISGDQQCCWVTLGEFAGRRLL